METKHTVTHTIISEWIAVHDPQYCFTVSCPTLNDHASFITQLTNAFGEENDNNWSWKYDTHSFSGTQHSRIYFNDEGDAIMFKLMFS